MANNFFTCESPFVPAHHKSVRKKHPLQRDGVFVSRTPDVNVGLIFAHFLLFYHTLCELRSQELVMHFRQLKNAFHCLKTICRKIRVKSVMITQTEYFDRGDFVNVVCENWSKAFSPEKVGVNWFAEFEMRAKNVAAEVFRVKTAKEAQAIVAEIIKGTGAKKIVGVSGPLQDAGDIYGFIREMGLTVCTDKTAIRKEAETADIGISHAEFGVAETGSVLEDAHAAEKRLVSTLVPIHIMFLPAGNIVPSVEEAITIVSKVHHRGYLSFITGPSRTADIERVLTIGVHGPSRLIIIAVDEYPAGGETK